MFQDLYLFDLGPDKLLVCKVSDHLSSVFPEYSNCEKRPRLESVAKFFRAKHKSTIFNLFLRILLHKRLHTF